MWYKAWSEVDSKAWEHFKRVSVFVDVHFLSQKMGPSLKMGLLFSIGRSFGHFSFQKLIPWRKGWTLDIKTCLHIDTTSFSNMVENMQSEYRHKYTTVFCHKKGKLTNTLDQWHVLYPTILTLVRFDYSTRLHPQKPRFDTQLDSK